MLVNIFHSSERVNRNNLEHYQIVKKIVPFFLYDSPFVHGQMFYAVGKLFLFYKAVSHATPSVFLVISI